MGSWVTYGLGTENQNLPGFHRDVPRRLSDPGIAELAERISAGRLPGHLHRHAAHEDREADRAHQKQLHFAAGAAAAARSVAATQRTPSAASAKTTRNSRRASNRSSSRIACRWMRPTRSTSAREPEHIREDVRRRNAGAADFDRAPAASSAACASCRCGTATASPGTITTTSKSTIASWRKECDQAIGALLKDLKQRGHVGGNAGRFGAANSAARPRWNCPRPAQTRARSTAATTIITASRCGWPAAACAAATSTATDEFGFKAVENPVHVHDLHATILWLLGFDHEKLTFRHAGRDFRLTDVHGNVVKELIA